MSSISKITHWRQLLGEATAIIATLNSEALLLTDWTLGGGTALMLQIGHRTSYDVDIFFDDPRLFGYLKRAISETHFTLQPTGAMDDGARFIKVSFGEFGEVDFIFSVQLLSKSKTQFNFEGKMILIDTCEEIILKKIFYRGGSIQPRDIFDIACVVEFIGFNEVLECIRQAGEKSKVALAALLRQDPDYYLKVVRELDIDERYIGIRENGYEITRRLLSSV